MSKKIFAFFIAVALVCAVSNVFAEMGDFFVDVQRKDVGGNNGFVGRLTFEPAAGSVHITIDAPLVVIQGQDSEISFTILNDSGRAIPDITAWIDPVFKKYNKDNSIIHLGNGKIDYSVGYVSTSVKLGDKLGVPYYSYSLSDGQPLTFTVKLSDLIDINAAGSYTLDNIEIWTRLGNKNFQDQLYGKERGNCITVVVVPPNPEFPEDIVPVGPGLHIGPSVIQLPNNANFGYVRITCVTLDGTGSLTGASDDLAGKTEFMYNANHGLDIFGPFPGDCILMIRTHGDYQNDNFPGFDDEIALCVIVENGSPVSAYFVCSVCSKEICICEEDE